MSVQAQSWAMAQSVGDPVAKLVLWSLANYADENGLAWPSVRTLTGIVECSRTTLFRKLGLLEELGLVEREQRHDDAGRQRSSNYRLRMHQAELELPEARKGGSQSDTPGSQSDTGRVSRVTRGGSQIDTGEGVTGDTPIKNHHLELPEEPSVEKTAREDAPPPPPAVVSHEDQGREFPVEERPDVAGRPRLVAPEPELQRADARPLEDQLRDYLGAHAGVVDLLALRLRSELWCAAVWGWFGPTGTWTDFDMGPVPAEKRGEALASALYAVLSGLEGDRPGIHQSFLRSCVKTVVSERWRQKRPFITAEEERRREAARRAVFRAGGDPGPISEILSAAAPAPEVVEREASELVRECEEGRAWFQALPKERQTAIRMSAQAEAVERFGRLPSDAMLTLILDVEIRRTRAAEAEGPPREAAELPSSPDDRREALRRQAERIQRSA